MSILSQSILNSLLKRSSNRRPGIYTDVWSPSSAAILSQLIQDAILRPSCCVVWALRDNRLWRIWIIHSTRRYFWLSASTSAISTHRSFAVFLFSTIRSKLSWPRRWSVDNDTMTESGAHWHCGIRPKIVDRLKMDQWALAGQGEDHGIPEAAPDSRA